MNTVIVIVSALITVFVISFFILGMMSRSGDAPGLVEGRLSECPDRPNCVCSEQEGEGDHYITPISLPSDTTFDALSVLKNIIREMKGSIQTERDGYLSATFSSAVFGFVDDVEIRIDSDQQMIHIRSASRVGYSDAGVNKKRSALLRQRFNEKINVIK